MDISQEIWHKIGRQSAGTYWVLVRVCKGMVQDMDTMKLRFAKCIYEHNVEPLAYMRVELPAEYIGHIGNIPTSVYVAKHLLWEENGLPYKVLVHESISHIWRRELRNYPDVYTSYKTSPYEYLVHFVRELYKKCNKDGIRYCTKLVFPAKEVLRKEREVRP